MRKSSSIIQRRHYHFTIAVLLLPLQTSSFFSATQQHTTTRLSNYYNTALHSEAQTSSKIDKSAEGDGEDISGKPKLTGSLSDAKWIDFELENHKPLGCSVEESLANEPDGTSYVFVSEVNIGGNAQNAGLEAGDVILRLSGTFDEVVDVAGLGINKIKSLVAGRPEDSTLRISVARGSDVMERHEMALVELCIIGDDEETANCINQIYAYDNFSLIDGGMAACEDDDGTECLLDSMWGTWTEGLPSGINGEEDEEKEDSAEKKKKAAPWSSRSSPSGTYVRDPKTGQMRNIDE